MRKMTGQETVYEPAAVSAGLNAEKVTKKVFGRAFFVALAILTQLGWIILAALFLQSRYQAVAAMISTVSILAVLWIANKDINPAYKLAWTILILAVPIAGTVIYAVFGQSRFRKSLKDRMESVISSTSGLLRDETGAGKALEAEDTETARQSQYIYTCAGYPVYTNTRTSYFHVGEDLYASMKRELLKAEHYIFLEYFIIDDGVMWRGILDILEQKARMGLDVRLIYDDVGCVNTLPKNFEYELRRRGIKCEVFNPFLPVLSIVLNNRDHRKIMIIDGHTAFTGGINLADEYINRKKRFGYWKDTGILLQGEAVWSFTVMFLQMWDVLSRRRTDFEEYRPHTWWVGEFENDGYVQPYGDTPLDSEPLGENIYLNLINRARKYIYIFTPYLITDNEMVTALKLAAKSGVDVRIVTPGVPDKKMVFLVTRSYYETLIEAGVRIFEYQPGFLHAKNFVCDDEIATIGTINLDFRSLYMHFECGVWMYRTQAVRQMKEDAVKLFPQCTEVTMEDCRSRKVPVQIIQSLLRLFAPLL